MVVLTATNGFCVDSAVKYINVEVPSVLTIPNVITPNGDGNNDVFYLNTFNIGQISMSVFDRWGLLMFENTDTGKMSWDGKNKSGNIVNDGIYFYTIKATGIDKKYYERKGTISVFK
jgi:gliding motility-associated-like protein